MDALSDVLRVVRLSGGVFLDARFSAPWSILTHVTPERMQYFLSAAPHIIGFHYIVSGTLVAHVRGGPARELGAGDLIVLPHNDRHVLGSAVGLTPTPANEIVMNDAGAGLWRLDHGGGGAETRIVCGFLGSDGGFNPVVAALPPLLTLGVADSPAAGWIAESLAFATQQLASGTPGGGAVIAKLSELMFVEAVRRHIETLAPEETGWLAGLRDPAVGRALNALHSRPQQNWSAEALAEEAHLSRSAFADRFTALIGLPPMRYVTAWRMRLATHKLAETQLTVAQIAYEVGYESEAAFSRAFRREMDLPPAAWRKRASER